jgi:hypothetical protein
MPTPADTINADLLAFRWKWRAILDATWISSTQERRSRRTWWRSSQAANASGEWLRSSALESLDERRPTATPFQFSSALRFLGISRINLPVRSKNS